MCQKKHFQNTSPQNVLFNMFLALQHFREQAILTFFVCVCVLRWEDSKQLCVYYQRLISPSCQEYMA